MIIVTGYSGFVGTNLRFKDDKKMIYLGRRNPSEINDKDQWINSAQPENWGDSLPDDCNGATLVHLAWIAREDYLNNPTNKYWLNCSKNLFDSFKNRGGNRFLSIGTSLETAPFQKTFGDTLYVKSKNEFREHIVSSGEVKSTWIIPHTLFGKFEDKRRLVPTVINALLGKAEPILKNPTEFRDFTPVNRLINMINDSIEKDLEGIFECKTGIETSVQTFVDQLSSLFETGHVGWPLEGIESELRETIHYWLSMRDFS
jgi:nucleoside-diphosphate-sugar epimerase